MRVVDVGDVADFIRGITFKPTDLISPDDLDAVVCMRTKNIQDELDSSDVIAVPSRFVRRDELFLRPEDLLISSANSWELVGKTVMVGDLPYRSTAGGFIAIVRAKAKQIYPRFLFHWIRDPRTQGAIRNCGRQTTNISNLSVDQFLALRLSIPPLQDQKKAAARLDKADAIRKKRREALKLADGFLRSVFLDLFGDPMTNSKKLATDSLGNLIKLKSGNFLPAHEMAPDGDIPVYGGNGVNGHHNQSMFDDRQVAIGRVGAYCGAVHITEPKSWITDNAMYVTEKAPSIQLDYLAFALKFANLNQYASQSGQPLVSGSRIYPIKIVVPPQQDQSKFESILRKMEKITCSQQLSLKDADELFRSLQQQSFA